MTHNQPNESVDMLSIKIVLGSVTSIAVYSVSPPQADQGPNQVTHTHTQPAVSAFQSVDMLFIKTPLVSVTSVALFSGSTPQADC